MRWGILCVSDGSLLLDGNRPKTSGGFYARQYASELEAERRLETLQAQFYSKEFKVVQLDCADDLNG